MSYLNVKCLVQGNNQHQGKKSSSPPKISPHNNEAHNEDQLPDYSQAFAVLNNPKYITDIDALHRFLDALGVSEAEDLADLDEEDFRMVFGHLKKISLKKFHRFLCRDIDPKLWGSTSPLR